MKIDQGFKSLREVVGSAMNPTCHKYGFVTYKLVTYWHKIVGSALSEISSPLQILFTTGKETGGVLVIGVSNPGFCLELQSSEDVIISKISTYFGYKAIDKIRIKICKVSSLPQKSKTKHLRLEKELKIERAQNYNARLSADDQKDLAISIREIRDAQLSLSLEELKDLLFDGTN